MTLYRLAVAGAAGNFIAAALTQSLPNAAIGVVVAVVLLWSEP